MNHFPDQESARAWLQANDDELKAACRLLSPRSRPGGLDADKMRRLAQRWDDGTLSSLQGRSELSEGRYQQAAERFERALALARQAGECENEASILGNLGRAYAGLGQHRQAIEYYEAALAIDRELVEASPDWAPARHGQAVHRARLGIAYECLDEMEEAAGHYEAALAAVREIDAASLDVPGYVLKEAKHAERTILGRLAGVCWSLGRIEQTVECWEAALTFDREAGDQGAESIHLLNLGIAHFTLGQAERATEYLEQAMTSAREAGDCFVGLQHYKLGTIHHALGQAKWARYHLEKALAPLDRAGATHYADLARQALAELPPPAEGRLRRVIRRLLRC